MIGELVLAFGPTLLGLVYLSFAARRFREVTGGQIRPEFGDSFHRSDRPGRYWFHVGIYLMGILLSLLALAWAALWIGVILEPRN